jgi:hypothetical protein
VTTDGGSPAPQWLVDALTLGPYVLAVVAGLVLLGEWAWHRWRRGR